LESKSLKNLLIQPQGKDVKQLPYSIYKNKSDFTLAQITQLGIEKLSASSNPHTQKPFFFMIEAGLIDWANHYNLAKEVYGEVKEFSEAIKVAVTFYKQHPEETLIIVTADHETGGSQILKKGFRYTTKEHTGNIVPVFKTWTFPPISKRSAEGAIAVSACVANASIFLASSLVPASVHA